MDLTMSSFGKLSILAVILVVFGIAFWSVGAPDSFQTALTDAGLASKPPEAALTAPAVPAPAAPAPEAPATQPAPPAQPPSDGPSPH